MPPSRKILLWVVALGVSIAIGMIFFAKRTPPPLPARLEPSASQSAAPSAAPPAPVAWPTPFSVDIKVLPPREALAPGTLRILVVGDSVASFLGLTLRYRQDEAKAFVAARGVGSCNIFESKPYIENGKSVMSSSCSMSWAEDAAELRPDVTLIVMGGAFFNERACDPSWQASYERRISELTAAMGANAGRVVITRVPYPMKDWRHGNVPARVDCFNEMLVSAARKHGLQVLDLMHYLCPTPACIVESGGKPIRPDGLHFDGAGAEETARWVLGELHRFARAEGR
jgi:hypothetical protein